MLVVLGPPFAGTDADFSRLAQVTGLVAYDLKTRLKPGAWGVVRALGDAAQAEELAERLRGEGFRACTLDPAIGADPERPFAQMRGLEIGDGKLVLHLLERSIPISARALLVVVRGEVHIGAKAPVSRASTSSTFRAVVPSASEMQVFRESMGSGGFDAFAAADLHFATVAWGARIDARHFEFSPLGIATDSPAQSLDLLVELLSERIGVRVDRGSRASSLLSYGAGPQRVATPVPGQPVPQRLPGDERFDAYSRLVAEAERRTRALAAPAPAPG